MPKLVFCCSIQISCALVESTGGHLLNLHTGSSIPESWPVHVSESVTGGALLINDCNKSKYSKASQCTCPLDQA